ncbi:hypothetical protein C5167_027670 [Papaver somniferum]|nr:hypothetical protein C5167_027670 [Papaver somniferum]
MKISTNQRDFQNSTFMVENDGGSGAVPRRFTGQPGAVGLVIGKGGDTIKQMQASSGARIQGIPLHPPPGDTSTERTVYIDGTPLARTTVSSKQMKATEISYLACKGGAEGGIEVFCNKVIAGSTSLELLFTSATRLFLGVVELYFCSVKILWKLRILVEL